MTTSVTKPCFTTQHQTCKTKTDFSVWDRSYPKTDGLRPHHWYQQHSHTAVALFTALVVIRKWRPHGDLITSLILIVCSQLSKTCNIITCCSVLPPEIVNFKTKTKTLHLKTKTFLWCILEADRKAFFIFGRKRKRRRKWNFILGRKTKTKVT